jgi:hypothetical protein
MVTKLGAGILISSPYKKTNFRGIGSLKSQNCFNQCLGPCCTDFNTGKNQGVTLRKFGEKKMFSPESMTKLEDLTVHKQFIIPCQQLAPLPQL